MDLKQLLLSAHKILDEAGIDHALIGGLALGALGVQRFTNDVDFLINGDLRMQAKIAFLKLGYKVFHESEEVLQLEGPGQIDFLFANRDLSRMMIKNAKPIQELGIKSICAEDLIALKIQSYVNAPKREFHDKADIQALIEKHKDLDWDKIKSYANIFNEWHSILAIKKKIEFNQ